MVDPIALWLDNIDVAEFNSGHLTGEAWTISSLTSVGCRKTRISRTRGSCLSEEPWLSCSESQVEIDLRSDTVQVALEFWRVHQTRPGQGNNEEVKKEFGKETKYANETRMGMKERKMNVKET